MQSSPAPHRRVQSRVRSLVRVGVVALIAGLLHVVGMGPASATAPVGDVNGVDSPAPGRIHIWAWAADADSPGAPVDLHMYFGPGFDNGINLGPANQYRSDVGNQSIDTTFDAPMIGTYEWRVYAIDPQGVENVLIETGQVTVADPTPTGAVESATSPGHRTIQLTGWASDPNAPSSPVAIEAYVGGSFSAPGVEYHSLTAGSARSDGLRGFSQSFTTQKTGKQDIYVYAKNVPGTPGSARLIGVVGVTVTIDARAPETTITSVPKTATPSDVIDVRFSADEPDASFECRWDDQPWFVCQTGTTVSLTPGNHTVSVRATDVAGNTDQTPATATVVVTDYLTQPTPAGPSIAVKAVKKKSRLRIDVDPDSADSNYRVTIQRKAGKTWRTVKRVRTRGARDVAVVDLRRGRYRVVLPASGANVESTSSTIRLKR